MTKPKNLLIASLSTPTEIGANGGAQVYILKLAKELVKLKIDVTIVGLSEKRNGIVYPGNENIEDVKIQRVGKGRLKIFQLRKWVKKNHSNYDVVLENMMQFPMILPLVLTKQTNYIILKHHFLGNQSIKVLGLIKGLVNVLNERVIIPLHNTPFMVPSNFTAQFLLQYSKLFKSKKILINPPGIDILSINEEKTSHPSILYTGTLNTNRKKVDHLIEAFKKLTIKIPTLELIICGDGPSRKLLEEKSKGYNVSFKGYVSLEDKMKYYAKSWVFSSPSLMEGFGITWIEAGYFKLPVVVYDIGIDTVNEKCAVLVEKNNVEDLSTELEKLIINKELNRKLGEAAYENAIKYSWENNSKRFVKFVTH